MEDKYVRLIIWSVILLIGVVGFWYYGRKKS